MTGIDPQQWAQQYPQLAAELRELGEPVDALGEALEVNRTDLIETGGGTVGWLAIAAVHAKGVEDWGWSPWWLGGVALALVIAIVGLIQFIALLCEQRQLRRAVSDPAGGDR